MILGLLAEFLLQFVIELAAEFGLHAAKDMAQGRNTMPVGVALLGYVVLGLSLGWLSLLVFPERFVSSSPVPGVSLVVPPLFAGLGMWGIGWLRRRHHGHVIRLDRFTFGFVFALSIALVRFALAR